MLMQATPSPSRGGWMVPLAAKTPIPSSARAAGTFSHWEKDYAAPCPYRPTLAITQSRIFQPEACVVSF
jgi:hypothetical protein